MNVFEEMRRGKAYDIGDKDYQEQVRGEIDRGNYLCQQINQTDTRDKETLRKLEGELFGGRGGGAQHFAQGGGAYSDDWRQKVLQLQQLLKEQ